MRSPSSTNTDVAGTENDSPVPSTGPMRIGVPPVGNQYLNLLKNSSLAAIISFPELTKVTQLGVATRAPSVPSYIVLLLIYLALSLVISLLVNLFNRRTSIAER